jgi:uncharacterized glyoxalase superfamily protein PhnB
MPETAPTIYPSLRYRDARAGIDWLKATFGFDERVVYENEDGTVAHAELSFGPSIVMLGSEKDDTYGSHIGQSWAYVAVEDADERYERARAAGAEIVRELADTDYGSRDFAVRDPEGNLWSFGTYRPAVGEPPE